MGNLIDRDDIVEIIESKQKELCPYGRFSRHSIYGTAREKFDDWQEILDLIDSIPTIDAKLLAHGKWKFDHMTGEIAHYASCSVCGKMRFWNSIDDYFDYCPDCGAKMDVQ